MLKVLKKYMKKLIFFSQKVVQVLHSPYFTTMINLVLVFNLSENTLSVPLFYYNTQLVGSKLLQHFHSTKALCVYILSESVRHIINTKNSPEIQKSAVLAQCP